MKKIMSWLSSAFDWVVEFIGKIPGFFRSIRDFFKRHKHLRRTLIALALIFLAVWLFLRFWPAFSARISSISKLGYVSRAINYDGEHFSNIGDFSMKTDYSDPYASRTTGKDEKPESDLPTVAPSPLEEPAEDELTLTWFGHSTLLLQMSGKNILFDPIFSTIASPVPLIGSHRYSPLACQAEDLPYIDIVIITHDHYDHLDLNTIKAIDGKVGMYIVPLGIENDLKNWGISAARIITMAWWEEQEIDGLTVVCAPARHYSGRGLTDRNLTLWASYILMNGSYKVYESGDSGTGEHFREIYNRYGDFDLVLMDCAQYGQAWHDVHMYPEEAVDAANILGAKAAVPIHWGAFVLSNHAWDDPAERFTRYADETGLSTVTPRLGETVKWEERDEYTTRWWQDIK